jgi:uncharacterized Zn finger protein
MAKQQAPVNLDLTNAQDVVCDNCGNYTFNEVVLMKRISAIVSPTGKEAIVPIPTFACNACGFINKQFLPVKMTEEQETAQESGSRIKLEK